MYEMGNQFEHCWEFANFDKPFQEQKELDGS